MTRFIFPILALVAATACADETATGYTDPDAEYRLTELNGAAYPHRATISFPEPGRVAGQAPCNRYFAELTVPYPWFGLSAVGATRMACPDLAAETDFFAALNAMTLIEAQGSIVILSNEAGDQMVFEAS